MKHPSRAFATLLLTALISVHAQAQSAAPARLQIESFASAVVSKACPAAAQDMLEVVGAGVALKSRPIKVTQVCACVERSLVTDTKLAATINAITRDQAGLRLSQPALTAYVSARMFQGLWACMALEVDTSLATVTLEDK